MDIFITGLAAPVALASVALIGYLVGQREQRQRARKRLDTVNKLNDTNSLIAQVEMVSDQLRRSMATHHSTVTHCRETIQRLSEKHSNDSDRAHHAHLLDFLGPTQRLSDDIAQAYDELRKHSQSLERLRRR